MFTGADVTTFVMYVLKLIVNPAVLLSVIILVGVAAYLHYQRRVMYQKKLKKVSAELSQERQDYLATTTYTIANCYRRVCAFCFCDYSILGPHVAR